MGDEEQQPDQQGRSSARSNEQDVLVPGVPQCFASYSPESGLHWGDQERPTGAQEERAVWFMLAAPTDDLEVGPAPDSVAYCDLPTLDVDTGESVTLNIVFSIGAQPSVVFVTAQPVPGDLLRFIAHRIASDLDEAGPDFDDWIDLASELRSLRLRILRHRVRSIEESVRVALGDEDVSTADYAALRSYPRRLARVEQLWSELPEPTWERLYAQSGAIYPVELAVFGNAGEEAREASARLSGLIASQSVVIAQRQAAQTERFQRLITIAGAAVLVPGLVAAVFGANVGFRGQQSSHGFWGMLLIMAGSAMASYSYLRSRERDAWKQLLARLPRPAWSPEQALAVTGGVAVVAIVAGICVLLFA